MKRSAPLTCYTATILRIDYGKATIGNVQGTITGADGGYLRIRLDGEKHSKRYHPTWNIQYDA